MKSRYGLAILLVLNGALAILCWFLLSTYRQEHRSTQSLRSDLLQLRQELGLERSRAADRDHALQNLGCLLTDLQRSLEAARKSAGENLVLAEPITEADQVDGAVLSRLSLLTVRPDVEKIERLPKEDWDLLNAKWNQMDIGARKASFQLERGADVETVANSPLWNTKGRTLSANERVELAVQLRSLQFFATTLPSESLYTIVLPEADRRRELAEYIEYSGNPPPLPEGVRLSHGESTATEGVSRMYYFQEPEYPSLYHRWYVGHEQALKAKVAIYETINGPIAPAPAKQG